MYSAVALSLAALAVAAPMAPSTGSSSSSNNKGGKGGFQKGTPYTANYDDIDTGLPVVGTLVGDDISQYQGLGYDGFGVLALGLAGQTIAGIRPESPPNVISYGGLLDTVADVLGLGDDSGAPLITTQYPGSAGNVFDLKSFFFACEIAVAGVAGVPQSCVVTVTGYKNAQQVADQEFTFIAQPLGLTEDMQKAKLSREFEGVDTVYFNTEAAGAVAVGALVATYLDNVAYTVYNAKDNNYGQEGNNYGNQGNNYGSQGNNYGSQGSQGQQGNQYGAESAKKNGTSSGW